MTYIDLLNRFWNLFPRQEFSCVETTLYLFLLNEANVSRWADSVLISNSRLFNTIKASPGSIRAARNKLQQLGLIQFKQGSKSEGRTKYWICDPMGSKYDPIIEPIIEPITEPIIEPIIEPITEPINKIKRKTIDDDTQTAPVPVYAHTREECEPQEVFDHYFRPENQAQIEQLAMTLHLPIDTLKADGMAVVADWNITGHKPDSLADGVKHLQNVLRKKAYERLRGNIPTIPSAPLAERKSKFEAEVKAVRDKANATAGDTVFDRDTCKAFYAYWTELSSDGTGRMRFELEKTWETSKRMASWLQKQR